MCCELLGMVYPCHRERLAAYCDASCLFINAGSSDPKLEYGISFYEAQQCIEMCAPVLPRLVLRNVRLLSEKGGGFYHTFPDAPISLMYANLHLHSKRSLS